MIVLRAINQDVRRHFSRRAPEWWMAFVMIGIGFQLCRNGEALEIGRVYAVMRWVGDDAFWGSIAYALGGLRLVALVLNGTFRFFRRISPTIRSITAFSGAVYWFCVCVSMTALNRSSPLMPLIIGMVAGELLLSAHIATEVGRVEKNARDASARD